MYEYMCALHIYMYIHVCIIYIHIHIYICRCVHYIYIYIYIFVYIYTYIHICVPYIYTLSRQDSVGSHKGTKTTTAKDNNIRSIRNDNNREIERESAPGRRGCR